MTRPSVPRQSVQKSEADLELLASLAKALAHPARIRILQILAAKQSCICGEIVDELPIAQSTVSQHLKELKKVGLITGTIDGPRTCYCLDQATMTTVQEGFLRLFSGLNCCGLKGNTHEFEK